MKDGYSGIVSMISNTHNRLLVFYVWSHLVTLYVCAAGKSILSCPIDYRKQLLGNICISGGMTCFAGFKERLQKAFFPISIAPIQSLTAGHAQELAASMGGNVNVKAGKSKVWPFLVYHWHYFVVILTFPFVLSEEVCRLGGRFAGCARLRVMRVCDGGDGYVIKSIYFLLLCLMLPMTAAFL